jgi:Cupin domain
MTTLSRQELAQSGSLEELYGKLAKVGMGAGWNKPTPSLWAAPRKTFVPTHWTYEQARGALDAAGRLINTELAERRNLILFNPAEGNTYGTVRTLVAAYQMIMPGEWARAHRHTPNALRLILDAEPGTYTEVDGTNIAMEPGDVLLTPNWSTTAMATTARRAPIGSISSTRRWCSCLSLCSSSPPRRMVTRPSSRSRQRKNRLSCSPCRRRCGGSMRRGPIRPVRSGRRSRSARRRSTPPRST